MLAWKSTYDTHIRPHLSPGAQKTADVRLLFLVYVLQRHSLWINLYGKKEPFESEDKKALVEPILSIIRNWLPSENEVNLHQIRGFDVGKRWLRFSVEIAILAAFEVLKFVWTCQGGDEIRRQFRYVCWRVLHALPIIDLVPQPALNWVYRTWNEVASMFEEGWENLLAGQAEIIGRGFSNL